MKMILGALSNKSLLLERWTRGVFAVHRQPRARVNCFVLFGARNHFSLSPYVDESNVPHGRYIEGAYC